MSTSLSQAANMEDESIPAALAPSPDKTIPSEHASSHRGRGADVSASSIGSSSTTSVRTTTLLPALPISPPTTPKRIHSASPPLTPPSGPSAQFSTPVGPSPSQGSKKTPGHSNDSPALLSPFRGQNDRSGTTGFGRSPLGRSTTPKPNPWDTSAQPQGGRSVGEPQGQQSPSRWHRQSFARGGGSSDDDGEDRLVEGMEYSLILVPHESEEEFMSNVHRVVPDGEVGTPSPEERTPSPVIPGPEGIEPTKRTVGGQVPPVGAGQAGPSTLLPNPGTPRRPETRPARVGAKFDTPIIPQRKGRTGTVPARSRLTRARDAQEAEEAIALVHAFESQVQSNPKGKAKEIQGKTPARGRLTARVDGEDTVMEPSTPPRKPPSLPNSGPTQRHHQNASPRPNSPLPKSVILTEKGVAIAVSPVKGRRLKLLRPSTPPATVFGSSPPNFEENISPAIRRWLSRPRSPPSSPAKPREKKRPFEEDRERVLPPDAYAALGIRVDAVPRFSAEVEAAVQAQERESKKRKRMDAFRDNSSDSSLEDKTALEVQPSELRRHRAVTRTLARPRRVSPLKPAQVDGLGRMAIHPGDLQGARVIPMAAVESGQTWRKTLFGLNVQEEDESLMSDVTTGGAGLRNLWRHRSQKSESSNMPKVAFSDGPSTHDIRLSQSLPEQGPGWPDLQYPWSTNEADRRLEKQRKQDERMAMVESFLNRESDSDSDSDMPATSVSGAEEDVARVRGLWTLGTDDSPRGIHHRLEPRITDHFANLFPSAEGSMTESGILSATPTPLAPTDPADARVALASRRDVRSVLYLSAKRREEEEVDAGVVDCICGEPDDGRAMVRCDSCKTWSHQACAGINDENELGECWYCAHCARETASTTHDGSAPTLVQGDASPERVVGRAERRTGLFMAPADEADRDSSPMDISSSPVLDTYPWPLTPRATESRFSTFPKTPSQVLDSRLHHTPRFFPDSGDLGGSSAGLDLLGTPSRGTKYNVAFVPTSTPLQPSSSSSFRRPLIGPSVFATPKSASQRKFGGGDNSAETALGSDGAWSVAATVKDQHGQPATPRPHYSMSFQYTETPIQRSKPRMGSTHPPNGPLSAPSDSPTVRKADGSRRDGM